MPKVPVFRVAIVLGVSCLWW